MRIAIEWIKSNLITVISIVVVVVSLIALILVPQMKGKGQMRAELQDRAKRIDTLNNLINSRITLPPARPDAEPQTINNVTVNDDVLAKLTTFYSGLSEQYSGVFDTAVAFNQRGHEPMLEGLFPRWDTRNPDIPFLARDQYLDAFDAMFLAYDSENPDAPRLDAGMPPFAEQLQMSLDQVRRDFVAADVSGVQLTEAEQRELDRVLREKLVDMLRLRAEQIHIYAHRMMDQTAGGRRVTARPMTSMSTGRVGAGGLQIPTVYPFQIGDWAFTNVPPQPAQLWEGQLELWIQQDLVRAIGRANRVDDASVNVLTAPVKRLVQMRVVPGYVGLHTAGAARDVGAGAQGGRGSASMQRADGTYPNPLGGQRTNNPDQRVSDNFYVGPTGRVSNALYDVRHAVLTVVADYQQLPALINAMSEVNFMTVLKVDIQDVDEYEALREGYMYGDDDVVLADLVVETIWLREWTEPLMPDVVLSYVGIAEPQVEQSGGMYDPMMDMGFDPMMDLGAY